MIFKLHYWFMAAGANALGILLGVFLNTYTDFTSTEIGLVYMLMPFCSMICRPVVCSFADRKQAHKQYMINSLLIVGLSYLPFVIIPLMGPEFYATHPRLSGYILLAFKIAGDIAFSSSASMGDSLAINYAHRVGTNFGVYRVWATISWMCFGMITGQINEIWFLPKYVPAFIILIMASLIDALLVWLWPAEYFIMVPMNQTLKRGGEPAPQKLEAEAKKSKVLLPRAVVWAHAKRKLCSLLTCSCLSGKADHAAHTNTAPTNGQVSQLANEEKRNSSSESPHEVDRKTQITILTLLLRRDPRIVLYFLVLVFAGASVVPLSFFFMNLQEICRETGDCNFSQLAGLLQLSMASVEACLFVYIKAIIERIGRLNALSVAFALASIKYGFYGTIWPSVNPYWSILVEVPHGVMFAMFLVLMVELAHFFSNEVEFIIPELVERGVVGANDEAFCEKLKMSLSATMQALMSSANDGIGRGFGALLYGILLDHYSYRSLWLIICIGSGCVCIAVQVTNIFDHCLQLRLGLDEQFKRQMQSREANSIRLAQIKEKGLNLSDKLDSISVHSRSQPTATKGTTTDIKMQQIA